MNRSQDTGEPQRIALDLLRTMRIRYKIDSYQQIYFVIDRFQQLYAQLKSMEELSANAVSPGDVVVQASN